MHGSLIIIPRQMRHLSTLSICHQRLVTRPRNVTYALSKNVKMLKHSFNNQFSAVVTGNVFGVN